MIEQKKARYALRVELFAAFDGLDIQSEQELKKRNFKAEIEKLIQELEGRDPKAVEREVYARYEFDLCRKCRNELIEKFENRQLP